MTLPTFLIGAAISTLLGAIFHLIRGGGLGRLIYYLVLGWIGFWAGHALAENFNWAFDRLGGLHLGTASIVSVLVIAFGHWISLVEVQKK